MGMAEMLTLLFGIITVAQYIIAWAAYAEKKYTAVSKRQCKILEIFALKIISILIGRNIWFKAEEITKEKQKCCQHRWNSEQHTNTKHFQYSSIPIGSRRLEHTTSN